MENKMYVREDKLNFQFREILRSTWMTGVFLVFVIFLGACAEDAKFKLKEGADNLRSVNQLKTNPSLLINNGSEYTDNAVVNLSFYPDGGAQEMFISLESDCSTGSWEPFMNHKVWGLPALNKSSTIYVKYKYKYHESECVEDGIIHDNIPPELEFGQKFETLWIEKKDLNISFSAKDFGSGVEFIHCDFSGSGNFKPCTEAVSFSSMEENRDYQLMVRVQDKAGNSVTKSLNWRSDQTPPEIVFNSKPAEITNDSTPQFSFTANDSGSGVDSYWCRFNGKSQFERCRNRFTLRLKDGEHQLEVKAMDKVGRFSQPISYLWTQDRDAPTISFTKTPSPITKDKKALFEFAGGVNNRQRVVSYQCRLDRGSYKSCLSPQNMSGLSDGRHSFSVVGFDQAENKSSPITYRWRVDTLPPTIALSGKPKSTTSSSRAVFSFQGQDGGGRGVKEFQCFLDKGSYQSCDSFFNTDGLSEGTHRFMVKAVDYAGNPSEIIQYQWLIDQSKPNVMITSKPDLHFDSNQALFAFEVTDQLSGIDKVECRLDGEPFKICESPVNYNGLSEGSHSFSVKALDKAGNPSQPQFYQWFIDTKGPEIVFVEKPDHTVYIGSRAKIHFTVDDKIGVGVKSYQCLLNNKPQNCSPDILYTVPATHYGDNTFQITAVDKLDNSTTETLNWTNKYELVSWQQEFKVKEDRPVDVLFVVDNSKSMNKEREQLAGKINGFLHKLAGLDWQVAVISTEIYDNEETYDKEGSDKYYQDGRLLPFDAESEVYILDSTMDMGVDVAQALFGDRITKIPVDTKGHEQGIYATVRAIERALDGQGKNAPNSRFFRKNAHLAVVVLSDEDENSKGEDIRYSPSQFLFFVKESFGKEKQITWHSIVIMSGDEVCKEADETEKHDFYGARYEKLSTLTGHGKPGGAVIGSICDEDYAGMLEAIGQSVKDKHNIVPLSCQPSTGEGNDEQGEVLVTHKSVNSTDYESYLESYVVQDQKVVFDELLEPGDYRFNFGCKK